MSLIKTLRIRWKETCYVIWLGISPLSCSRISYITEITHMLWFKQNFIIKHWKSESVLYCFQRHAFICALVITLLCEYNILTICFILGRKTTKKVIKFFFYFVNTSVLQYTTYMYIKTNIILTENSRKRSNLISLTIKLIWFLFGEMHLKRCYCTFYLVHVAFIDSKAEKTPEFF